MPTRGFLKFSPFLLKIVIMEFVMKEGSYSVPLLVTFSLLIFFLPMNFLKMPSHSLF